MILVRRPFAIHDVDLVGAALLLAVGCGFYFAIARPEAQAMRQRQALRDAAAEAGRSTGQLRQELRRATLLKADVGAALAQDVEGLPSRGEFAQFLSDLAARAKAAGLEVLQMTPLAQKSIGEWSAIDVQMSMRGGSREFISFLQRLDEWHRYQEVSDYQISAESGEDLCKVEWTLRVYLIKDGLRLSTGAAP